MLKFSGLSGMNQVRKEWGRVELLLQKRKYSLEIKKFPKSLQILASNETKYLSTMDATEVSILSVHAHNNESS